jgi:hypothetical protein
MHKNTTKSNKTQSKWCINKHGASKIIDTLETYQEKIYPLLISIVCLSIWTTRNKVIFDKYVLRSPITIVFVVCSFSKYWSVIYKDEDKGTIMVGKDQIMKSKTASKITGKGRGMLV